VQRYCAKILEEVDEGAALALMQAESDVSAREASLKGMREEVRSIASIPLLCCFIVFGCVFPVCIKLYYGRGHGWR
jgi:hypothetical protein